jgi:hypothetical protein
MQSVHSAHQQPIRAGHAQFHRQPLVLPTLAKSNAVTSDDAFQEFDSSELKRHSSPEDSYAAFDQQHLRYSTSSAGLSAATVSSCSLHPSSECVLPSLFSPGASKASRQIQNKALLAYAQLGESKPAHAQADSGRMSRCDATMSRVCRVVVV